MDVKSLSPDVIKKKILDVALSMTGADDGDIEVPFMRFVHHAQTQKKTLAEADTPLMEAGLTSTSAVTLPPQREGLDSGSKAGSHGIASSLRLRDELMKDLVGVNLPVTLVFDYPSISAMTELVMEGF